METKNEPIPKEIIAATAAEPEYECLGIDLAVPENADTPIDWSQFVTANLNIEPAVYAQQCMLCDNTRNLGGGWHSSSPWVCNECKEAIAYAKEIMKHRGAELFYDQK
jgi:hypothetical protein